MSKKKYDDDDGRQIADMGGTDRSLYDDPFSGGFRQKQQRSPKDADPRLRPLPDRKETRRLIRYTLKISLLIGLVFIVGALIFIPFRQYVWLR
jgi:hypothetical protein